MHAARVRRLAGVLLAGGVLLLVAAIAVPLGWTWWQAKQAQEALVGTVAALQDDDLAEARDLVESARVHADRGVAARDGVLGSMWRHLPVLAPAADDSEHLADAISTLTEVAELGVETYPVLTGDQGRLISDGSVDLPTLTRVLASFDEVRAKVAQAQGSMAAVTGDAPLIGSSIVFRRDDGLADLRRVSSSLDSAAPLVDVLPDLLGERGRRDYLIAILNPAEQLYSGGTPLTFTPMSARGGTITMGTPQDTATHGAAFVPRYWPKVKGNPFHRGRLRVATAAFAPDWRISGEEMLRAWRSLRGKQMDGVIAIDIMALRDLIAITGPLDVPYYGEVNAENFVPILLGNYDAIPDYRVRHQINQSLVPIFRDRFFETGAFIEKATALKAAAAGRHFAVYLRDPDAQAAMSGLDLTGELSQTKNDYLGVFTQNAVPSKTDYWQSRTLSSDVVLAADGSAHVTATTQIHNDTTPYPFKGRDPRRGYSTRFATLSIAQFLPMGATNVAARVDDELFEPNVNNFFGRPFLRRTVAFRPQATHQFAVAYDVPRAATRSGDELVYALDIDPQGLVRPSAISVTVHLPDGFEAVDLPAGWFEVDASTIAWGGPALVSRQSFEVTLALRQ